MSEESKADHVYYMFHKPAGCITANRDEMHRTVMDYFDGLHIEGLHPVGRLDKDTEGLLFVTNDGKWTQQLMHPVNQVPKTYFFWSMGELTEENMKMIREGVMLRGGKARPAEIVLADIKKLKDICDIATGLRKENRMEHPVYAGYLTIYEGRKHQVKRMIRAIGGYVVYLKRVSIGGVMLDAQLKPGEYRLLNEEEKKIVKNSG